MGVGDYVHSREAGQPRPTGNLPPSQRQLRAEQAKVEVPSNYFKAPVMNGLGLSRAFQASPVPSDQSRDLPETFHPLQIKEGADGTRLIPTLRQLMIQLLLEPACLVLMIANPKHRRRSMLAARLRRLGHLTYPGPHVTLGGHPSTVAWETRL